MSLARIVELRDTVNKICEAIDRGDIDPSEEAMMHLAVLVSRGAGPLKHDLLVKLASRCKNGSAALSKLAH